MFDQSLLRQNDVAFEIVGDDGNTHPILDPARAQGAWRQLFSTSNLKKTLNESSCRALEVPWRLQPTLMDQVMD